MHIKGDKLGRSYTPQECADAVMRRLVDWLPSPFRMVEPCLGGGAFVSAAMKLRTRTLGYAVGHDLDPNAPGIHLVEQFDVRDAASGVGRGYDLCVTNPPFGKAVGQAKTLAILRACRQAANVTALVLPIDYLTQAGFEDDIAEAVAVWPLLPRPFPHERGQMVVVWSVEGGLFLDGPLAEPCVHHPLRWR